MKKLMVALGLTLGFSTAAHAGLMIEPYLGYEMGKSTSINTTTAGQTTDGKLDGVDLGVRLGYKTPLMLWFALDAQLGVSGDYKPDTGSSATQKHNTYYGVVGIDLPILFRAWAGYGFQDTFKTDTPYSSDIKGKNFKLGAGFTGLPFISLNLEYLKGTVDSISGGSLNSSNVDGKTETYMVSVSLPLNL